MRLAHLSPLLATALFAAACSGGGGGSTGSVPAVPVSNPNSSVASSAAYGTLTIGSPHSGSSANVRRPKFISPSSRYATLWIDGTATGFRVPCATVTCTINWTSTSGPHTFYAAVDDALSATGPGYVLAEGSEGVTLQIGTNTVPAITLNGIAEQLIFESATVAPVGDAFCSETLPAVPPPVNCMYGLLGLADIDGNLILSPGVFENAPINLTAFGFPGAPIAALASGGPFTPDAVGNDYGFAIACAAEQNGGIVPNVPEVGGYPDEPSAAQLATYQLTDHPGITQINWPTLSCTNGQLFVVAAANGSVTVQSGSKKR